ncbi:MAG: protein kinase, partial [Deltaproteobacteria bacterium]|nr:protein kinase [Deltaproteobacteria bacterium]
MSEGHTSCAQCGSELAPDALFCTKCGAPRSKSDDSDPLLGQVVGARYLLTDKLGEGGSGTIYAGEHVTLRRKVAVKVLHHELSRDDLSVERFRREATTVAEIENPHIVQIHDFGRTEDDRLYLAMEFLEGETLDARLEREVTLAPDVAVEIILQLAEALMEAHAIGYVHRDLRPRNIFLSKRRGKANYVKLLDFGLAKLVDSDAGEAAMTSLGMTFGDPKYMSPEQARGDSFDRRADIYALGCIAYEMLTGSPPFVGGKVFDILTRHVEESPKPPHELRAEIPAWLSTTVLQMLAKGVDDRFVTVYRLAEALQAGAEEGVAMPADEARRIETVPPPSISQAMERFTDPGSAPYQVRPDEAGGFQAVGEPADEPGPRTRPSRVMEAIAAAEPTVPADDHPTARVAAPLAGDDTEPYDPGKTVPGIVAAEITGRQNDTQVDPPANQTIQSWGKGKLKAAASDPTPVPGRIATPVDTGRAQAEARRIADTDREAASRDADREAAHDANREAAHDDDREAAHDDDHTSASGKSRARSAASSSAGISAAWFAHGEALSTGEDVDSRHAEKLRRARGGEDLATETGEIYFDEGAPTRFRLIAAGGVALMAAMIIILLTMGGDDDEAGSKSPDAGAAVAAVSI